MNITTQNTPDLVSNPTAMPFIGFISGVLIWFIDASIDVFILHDEQTLIQNIFNPEATELWMRTLVIFVLVNMGMLARRTILKHIELDRRMLNHQKELEQLVAQRTQELLEKSQQLQIIADQDPLTQLANRRKFNKNLDQEFHRYQRYKKQFSITILDIDNFKSVNDNFGHNAGDQVLISFAEILLEICRCTDTLARWGGEEFILLSIETSLEQTLLQANKIIDTIRATDFPQVGKITASIGLSCSTDQDTPELIINRADNALYKAKQNGRDRIEY